MASVAKPFGLSFSPSYFPLNLEKRACNNNHCRYPTRALARGDSSTAALSGDYVELKGAVNVASSYTVEEEEVEKAFGSSGNGFVAPKVEKIEEKEVKLEPLWDDGYGQETVKEYMDYARDLIKPDGGPARWFTPLSCGPHLKGSPVLLFLPGMDGLGLGLILHHRSLGKVFDVWCMHIPVHDRTNFEGLLEWVEKTVRAQHASSPKKPIYMVGDSFGGCLALAVAAHNPHIDLVLILANPATSIDSSQLQPLFPLFETLPTELHSTFPYFLSTIMGDPVKMASVNIDKMMPPPQFFEQLSSNLTDLLPRLSVLADILPKESLIWKLKLIRQGAAYANARLHAVKAEVLVLASGNDGMLPSQDEARRLWRKLKNCKVRLFKDNGHTILLEDGVNLLSVIKGAAMYRRSRTLHYIKDFIPPSSYDLRLVEQNELLPYLIDPVVLSTLEDGKVVRGLEGVPDDGPVLLIGYHMLMGLELIPLLRQFLREKKILIRGIAHPALFALFTEAEDSKVSYFDTVKAFGASPVNASNFFELLKMKSHVLLYPGGAREALHKKGEAYKLFWPEQPEFVRMAAKFGATIVPFGVVGEDDITELVLDYEDQMKIPFWNEHLRKQNEQYQALNTRRGQSGEVARQPLFLPGLLPKVPGRFYFYFGKPIETKGRKELLHDREKVQELYLHVKSQVEANIAYLLEKRKSDPYRGIVDRTMYRALNSGQVQVPTFEL